MYSPVRLHVDSPLLGVQAVRLQRARLAQALDLVHHLVSAVVTGSWQTLGVLAAPTSPASTQPTSSRRGTKQAKPYKNMQSVRFTGCTRYTSVLRYCKSRGTRQGWVLTVATRTDMHRYAKQSRWRRLDAIPYYHGSMDLQPIALRSTVVLETMHVTAGTPVELKHYDRVG